MPKSKALSRKVIRGEIVMGEIGAGVGDILKRTDADHPDGTDPMFNVVRGGRFRITDIQPGVNVTAVLLDGINDRVGSEFGIPEKKLMAKYWTIETPK